MNNPVSTLLLQLSRIKMKLTYFLYIGALTLLLITFVTCTKCGQLSFCKKLRQRNPTYYALKVPKQFMSSLYGMLINMDTGKHFNFVLTALAGGKFTIYLNDNNNSMRRVDHTLTETPAETSMIVNINKLPDGEELFVDFEDINIIIFTNPFNLTAYRKGKEFLKVNTLSLVSVREDKETAIALDFIFPQGLRAYGLPEHAESLALRTTTNGSEPYRLYNTDRFGYKVNSTDGLYGSVPVLYCLGLNTTAGVFWQNAAQTFVDITNNKTGIETYFMSESGALEAYILTGPTLKDCVKQYSNLTGTAPLPQTFALGYHQSRYSYMNQNEVLDVSKKFDENKMPLDAVWLDIHYSDQNKYFTWNPKTFPNPNALLDSLNKEGRQVVAIINPHIKREKGYSVFDECEEKGYFVKKPHSTTSFEGASWAGLSSWIDFINPEALKYYSSLITEFAQRKNLHIWNDMNEPAVFEAVEQTMDGNCMHYSGWLHKEVHNQYGFYQTIGTYEGLMERGAYQIRPFVLTRSFYAGSQRYAAHWTGDNVADWNHLKISIPMILTGGLAGLSLVGADVGGFSGNPSEELLQRWYQLGAWYPLFRAHSHTLTKPGEPYLFSDEVKFRIRKAILQRYRHLPYWYTLFWEHHKNADPVIRPLIYHYFDNLSMLDIDNEFLVGANILVHPVCDEQAKYITVYLPGGEDELWYNIDDYNKTYSGIGNLNLSVSLDTVPVFYKGGSIIPIKETLRHSTAFMKNDPLTLLVFLDKNNNAIGTLYDDDQVSFDYLKNKYAYISFSFINNTLENNIINKQAQYNNPIMLTSVVVYGLKTEISGVYIAKNKTSTSGEGISMSIDFQNMYTCGVKKNDKTITIYNLDLDLRYEFMIKFKENIPK